MAVYFAGPEPGRIISAHDASESTCNARDRDRKFFAHKHAVVRFGEAKSDVHTICDFQLRATGGWPEIEAALASAPVTKRKDRR